LPSKFSPLSRFTTEILFIVICYLGVISKKISTIIFSATTFSPCCSKIDVHSRHKSRFSGLHLSKPFVMLSSVGISSFLMSWNHFSNNFHSNHQSALSCCFFFVLRNLMTFLWQTFALLMFGIQSQNIFFLFNTCSNCCTSFCEILCFFPDLRMSNL
jgi:hypothetical protein